MRFAKLGRGRDAGERRGILRPFYFFRDLPRVWPYLRPRWQLGTASLVLMGLGIVASLLSPWPLAILIDSVLGNQPLPSILGSLLADWDRTTLLVLAVLAGLGVTALENGLGVLNGYVNTRLEQAMVLDLRSDMFGHAHRLSQAFHDRSRTGTLMYQINNQAHAAGAVTVAIPPLIQAVGTLGAMFFVTYKIDPRLALLSLTVVPFIYYSTGFYATRIEPRLYRVRGLEGQSLSIVHEAMRMLRVIVAFGRERHEYGRFRRQGEEAVNARVDLTVRQTAFSLGVNGITAAGTALVLGFGGWGVMHGDLTVGELLVVMGYIAAVYQPLEQISGTIASLQEQFVALRHAFGLLDTEPEIKEAADAVELARVEGRVAFEDVDFAYEERLSTLKAISFEAEPGECIGIVGPTGAGKTTLVSLIPRFYDPQRGRILLDGTDLRALKLESLRRQISVVHQEPMLFSGTIADNIRYGDLEATEQQLEQAARDANAHDFVSRLPKQYETQLGEGGPQLSGGERQRIAVARAFLKDAPILVLDEPTSAIDSKTEAVILEALERLMVGRTTFLVAHRLSTLQSADRILVMNNGAIVERGRHDELLAHGGLYRQLWEAQTGQARLRVIDAGDEHGRRRDVAELPKLGDATVAELRGAIRMVLGVPPKELAALASKQGEAIEIRLAAGILAALARGERELLTELGRERLEALVAKRGRPPGEPGA